MDLELLKTLGGLGVGGVVTWLVMNWKRNDDQAIAKERVEWANQVELHYKERIEEGTRYQASLLDLINRQSALIDQNTGAIRANTEAIRELGSVTTILEELRKAKPGGV